MTEVKMTNRLDSFVQKVVMAGFKILVLNFPESDEENTRKISQKKNWPPD
jgi:hypothetical protein